MDLIKVVRGLNPTGPGKDGTELSDLWKCLTASTDTHFHAAQESALRWLLKSMNGSSPDAETLRRYPLTWAILGSVFQSIPLFSLAKSLADRRFISILQQTLNEISNPLKEGVATPGKRKRGASPGYDLAELKVPGSCIQSGQAVFGALRVLLSRCDGSSALSSHDRIGAEHLKSLFCSNAAEAKATIAPLLSICELLLKTGLYEVAEDWETWPKTISQIWNLHLQGPDDASQVATHLFLTVALILSKIENLSSTDEEAGIDRATEHWSSELQDFMHRNLILPARTSVVNGQSTELIVMAMEVSKSELHISAPVLYFLAARATENLTQRGIRNGNDVWMTKVFQLLEARIRFLKQDGTAIIQCILQQAKKRSMTVDVEDLRAACHQYALRESQTEWALVAIISQCDSDVYQTGEAADNFLKEICGRIQAEKNVSDNHQAIGQILDTIAQSFRTCRKFSSFLRLWYEQMCAAERNDSRSISPWFDMGRRGLSDVSLQPLIEQELSPQQLRAVLEWGESQKPQPQTLSLWTSTITQGIRSEEFKQAAGPILVRLAGHIAKSSSPLVALKWRVISKALSWAPSAERDAHWIGVKKKLAKILEKRPVKSAETFEAFKCCCQLSVAMSPDGEFLREAEALLQDFTARLAETISVEAADFTLSVEQFDSQNDIEYREENAIHQYIAWYLRGSSRLTRAYFASKGVLPSTLQYVDSDKTATLGGLAFTWESLLSNEHNLNDSKVISELVERLIKALRNSKQEEPWPGKLTQFWLQKLNSIPLEVIARAQRESIMSDLIEKVDKCGSSRPVSVEGWISIVSLVTKLMGRPTFYKGMSFQHLIEIADLGSEVVRNTPTTTATLLELIDRFSLMVAATIRQMTESDDVRSTNYLSDCEAFALQCAAQEYRQNEASPRPLHLTLLRALFMVAADTSVGRSQDRLAAISNTVQKALKNCVGSVLSQWVADRKLFTKDDLDATFILFAAIGAAESGPDFGSLGEHKASRLQKLDSTCQKAMVAGDLRAWKLMSLLRRQLPQDISPPRSRTHQSLEKLPSDLRLPLQKEYVEAITSHDGPGGKMQYLKHLIGEYEDGCRTDGQLVAIQTVIEQLLDSIEPSSKDLGLELSEAHGSLSQALANETILDNCNYICHILYAVLEKKPQVISQWNVEVLFASIVSLCSRTRDKEEPMPYLWLCRLVEIVIKKHRIRLEGHYHIVLPVLQSLLASLVLGQDKGCLEEAQQDSMASAFGRLPSMICEPTAGAVARSHHGALDSATDAAKRSAGRHMYLILMQYVKLQLEANVPRTVRESVGPAMNSIFDITPPEGRKILNDAMDANGRAILREMFKIYTKFGKWTGV